jgi:hypothetical protein
MPKINFTRLAAQFHLLGLAAPLRLRFSPAILQSGWLRSFLEQKSVDVEGKPIPFMSYAAVDLLTRRVPPGITVFEFGSGYSTLWWASRVGRVIACEHDRKWRDLVVAMAPRNVEVLYRTDNESRAYAESINEAPHPIDVVVIDGGPRVECARACLPFVAPNGIIIWDDTDRDQYRPGIQELRDAGFKQLQLSGLGPIVADMKCTSIFYRQANLLGL